MGLPVVTVASGGLPVVDCTSTLKSGTPVTESTGTVKYGVAVTKVASGGMPVVYETIGAGITPTTWNPADKNAAMTLSNGNLTAAPNANWGGVRAIKGLSSGKYYFEITATVYTSGWMGLAQSNTDISNASTLNAVAVNGTGAVQVNGVAGINVGTVNGATLGVAADLSGGLVWFRVAAAGNWNGSAGNNPATGVGGINIAAIAGTLYPYFEVVTSAGQSVTANFGASAFTGAVPSGFTAGWG